LALVLTTTRFGRTWLAKKLRLDASGLATSAGHTVTCDVADPFTAVTLRTTAVTPVDGTPPTPVTSRVRVVPGPNGVAGPPVPSRVSSTRAGVTPTNRS